MSGVVRDEHWRLGGRPPLKTILVLSIGPLFSQVAGSLYGVMNTWWVSKGLGTKGVSAIATYSPLDNIGRSFATFLQIATSSRVASLFGSGNGEEASQVLCDLIRFCFVIGAVVPLSLLPWAKYLVRWFNADESVVDYGFHYICVTLGCSVISCLFLCVGGALQGEGKSLFLGVANVISSLVNMFIFDPLFILHTNLGVTGAGVAVGLSESLPMLVILIMYFAGKFSVKPKLSQLFKPFSPHTKTALKIGFSQLISMLSMNIPSIFIMKFTGSATNTPLEYKNALAACGVILRYALLTFSVLVSINLGYLPAAAYSYAKKDVKRWKSLTVHAAWINCLWGLIASIVAEAIPSQICGLFSKDEGFLDFAVPMLRYISCAFYLAFLRLNIQSMLQSMQKGTLATILSVSTQFLTHFAFAWFWYLLFPHDPRVYQLSYPSTFLVGGIIAMIVVWKPVRAFLESRENEGHTLEASLISEPEG